VFRFPAGTRGFLFSKAGRGYSGLGVGLSTHLIKSEVKIACSCTCTSWHVTYSNHCFIQHSINFQSSCLHRASIVSKTLFIVPTDAHYYKIIELLKQFKITILAPTCFGSRRNHHQGAVLCLAKTTKWIFCARRYRRIQCYGCISACCADVRFTVETGTAHACATG
jgi:hypothetical protein